MDAPRRHAGGFIPPHGPTTVPVVIHPGDYRVSPEALRKYGARLFDALNEQRERGLGR